MATRADLIATLLTLDPLLDSRKLAKLTKPALQAALDGMRAEQAEVAATPQPAEPEPEGEEPETPDPGPGPMEIAGPGTAVEIHDAELVDRPAQLTPSMERWAAMRGMAEQLARSGLVKKALQGKPDDVLLILLVGHDLGISPTTALAKVNVIEGAPSMSAELMAALIRRAGHSIEGEVERNDKGQPVRAWVRGSRCDTGESMPADFTINDAHAAGLCSLDAALPNGVRARSSYGKVLPWEQHTGHMLWARAMSTLGRRLFPDVLAGVSYTPEELTPELHVEEPPDTRPARRPRITDDERAMLNGRLRDLDPDTKTAVVEALKAEQLVGRLPLLGDASSADVPKFLAVIESTISAEVEDAEVVETVEAPPCETDPADEPEDLELAGHVAAFAEAVAAADAEPVTSLEDAVAEIAAAQPCAKCSQPASACECAF